MEKLIVDTLHDVPSTRIASRFFDGSQWTQCDYGKLTNEIKRTSEMIHKLTGGTKQCLGLCVSPFLGLPALILSATLSSCPFIFFDIIDLVLPTASAKTRLNQLGIRWIFSNESVSGRVLRFCRTFELEGNDLTVYENLDVAVDVQNPYNGFLYAITTSGSTGSPKIVRVTEESILPNILDFSAKTGLSIDDGILLSSALTFDPSMVEFFLSVLNSAPLIIVNKDVKARPQLLFQAIVEGGVSFYQTTPSLFRTWPFDLRHALLGPTSTLKALVLGGEPFPRAAELKGWKPSEKVQIYNTYGITEVSCWATLNLVWPKNSELISDGCEIDIGEVLSETLLETTEDETGQLYHLSIGSSSRVCLIENESFNELPSGKPIFRPTGDLFKIIDGKYFFHGRMDSFIKRFGKKVNLTLIEQKGRETGLECAVAVRTTDNYDSRLTLFVKGHRDSDLSKEQIKSLKSSLPGDHWPDEIVFVETLPLSKHGKLNGAQLKLYAHRRHKSSKAPTRFEELWNFFTVGTRSCFTADNCRQKGFVSAGGNSFTAVLFINSLEDEGLTVHPDLLLTLLKDLSFDSCQELFQTKSKVDSTQEVKNEPSMEIEQSLLSNMTPSMFISDISMALKGRVWPTSVSERFRTVWTAKRPITIEEEWKVDLLKCVDASPLGVVCDGETAFLIIGSHSGLVVVLQYETGKILSQTQLPSRVEASACLSSDYQSYYIGCYDGKVYKVNVADGNLVWHFQTKDQVKSTCVIHREKLLFGSYDKHLYAITESGDLKWRRWVGPTNIPVLPYGSCVFVGTLNGSLHRINVETGVVEWRTTIGAPMFSNLLLMPYHDSDNCLLVCPVNGRVHWRDVHTLNKMGELNQSGTVFASPLVINNSELIVANHNVLRRLQPPNTLWTKTFNERIVSTPFFAAGVVITITINGNLYLLDVNDGETLGTYSFPGEVFSSPVVIGSRVFVGCRDNNFYCLKLV